MNCSILSVLKLSVVYPIYITDSKGKWKLMISAVPEMLKLN